MRGWILVCMLLTTGPVAFGSDPERASGQVKPLVKRPVGFPPAPPIGANSPTQPLPKVATPQPAPQSLPPLSLPLQPSAIERRPTVIDLPGQAVNQAQAQIPVPPVPQVIEPAPLPEPKALPELSTPGPTQLERRLPTLAAPAFSTPTPSEKTLQKYGQFVEQIVDPENTLDIVLNRERLMRFKDATRRVQVSDTNTLGISVIGPREISLTGKKVGSTVLNLWFADPTNPNRDEVLSYLVRVLPDPELRDRLERVYQALAEEINTAFPDSVVKLQLVGDKLVVSGHAKDVADAFQILRIARANAPQTDGAAVIPVGQVNLTVPAEGLAEKDPTGDGPSLQNYLVAGGPNVVNQLRVGGEQQVMLKEQEKCLE